MTRLLPLGVGLLAALLACVLAAPNRASAWSCGRNGCPRWCAPPTYVIGPLSSDLETLSPGTTVNEVTSAMADWTIVTCTGLESTASGTTTMAPVYGDQTNAIAWHDTDWAYDPNVIGVTTVSTSGGCLVEADVEFNGVNYAFTTSPGSAGIVNAYTAILHEGGHFYGLGHSEYIDAAMYFSYALGTRTITPDDANGICALYPGSDPPPDCTVVGCPRGEECQAGTCVLAQTPPCTTDANCPATQRCDLATGKCVLRDPGAELGIACASDAECATGLCVSTANGAVCSQTCDALNTYSCPVGFYCSGSAVDDCAMGVCLAGDPGPNALGTACAADTECSSLFCASGVCSTPCDPADGDAKCPSGLVCHPHDKGACGGCGAKRGNGEPCDFDNECMTGLCYADDATAAGFCTSTCTTDAECGDGFACTSVGTESVCVKKAPAVARGGCDCRSVPGSGGPSSSLLVLLLGLACVQATRNKRTRR